MIAIFQELPDECKDYVLQQIEQLKKLHTTMAKKAD
jgi:hypothetical protein